MDFKFARLQDVHVKFNGLEWNKMLCRLNQYHMKTILVLLFIGSFSFILIQNSPVVNDVSNNYGIDCNMVQRFKQGEIDEVPTDKEIVIQHSLDSFLFGKRLFRLVHRPLLNCLAADDPHLTHVIREDLMTKPLPNKEFGDTYALTNINTTDINFHHQTKDIVEMIFKNKKKGFFVEAGAFDCENSITLPLEFNIGWTGILVEPTPEGFARCEQVNRKAHLIQTCLGTKETPYFTNFDITGGVVKVTNTSAYQVTAGFASTGENGYNLKLQCFPLYSLLLSLGNPTVNLFVLDIEGYELSVLETIPWDKVDIEVLDIETDLAGVFQKDSSREKIINLMDKNGYDRFDHRNDIHEWTQKNQNDLFVRRDIVKKYNVRQL